MMKTKMFAIALAMSGIIFQSCGDENGSNVNNQVANAFKSMYPEAQRVSWNKNGSFSVASFLLSSMECEAWFNADAKWRMTESNIAFDKLPQAVKMAFEASEYANWTIDDIDMVERDSETLYVIEVEKGKEEVDLYYLPDGTLIKTVMDADGSTNYIPNDYLTSIQEFVAAKYPGARIVDTEKDDGMIEVDIIDNGTRRELNFTLSGEWKYTKTEIRKADVPQNIMNILLNSQYGLYKIDDVDFYETSEGNHYRFELEGNNIDIDVIIDTNGNLTAKEDRD